MPRIAHKGVDRKRPEPRLAIGAKVPREAPAPGIEAEQSVQRTRPQRAVAVIEQCITAVVDRNGGVDGIMARAVRGDLHAAQAPGMGADPQIAAAVGQDTLDVVGEQRPVVGAEIGKTARRTLPEVDAVVVGADPQSPGRFFDDAAHRIIAQRVARP